MSDQEKLTTYGALITVFALLLIVVYAPDDYDIWDAVIGGAAVWFGLFYLLSKLGKDLFSITLGSALVGVGAAVILFTLFGTKPYPCVTCTACNPCMHEALLLSKGFVMWATGFTLILGIPTYCLHRIGRLNSRTTRFKERISNWWR